MSYRRSFHKRIAIHYSGSVSYPASENGGSVSYSGTEYEDVEVNIDVETTPFENSIEHCNNSVNFLTGAVVATEAAQIASIDNNARKIGSTIVEGFFKTIRSEISQQIAELSIRLDATLIHLNKMAKRCIEKQKQMESDYNSLSGRYFKIFDDLNNELSNRIYELDKPVFVFKEQNNKQNNRTSENDLVSTVTVFGAEDGDLQARISASIAKKRALDTLGKANIFLIKQKRLNNTINQSMLKDSISAVKYSPVCYVETQNDRSQIDKNVYQANYLPSMQKNDLITDFQDKNWIGSSKENNIQIGRYFNSEVNNRYSDSNMHTSRVRENIIKMFDLNQIKTL